MHRSTCLGVVTLLGISAFASADTFQTFDVNGVLDNGNALTGTLTLDTSTNLFTGVDVSASAGGVTYQFNGKPYSALLGAGEYEIYYSADPNVNNPTAVLLILPVDSVVGYNGSALCSLAELCGFTQNSSGFTDDAPDGGASVAYGTVTAATPEPESLVLLGSGLTGVLGVMRRRKMSR